MYITILAGGLGKRMKSDLPKVLHKFNGKPMLVHIIETARKINPDSYKIIIVVGKYYPIIKQTIEEYTNINDIMFSFQEHPLGTGDAVKSTLDYLVNATDTNIILNGDTPLLQADTIQDILENYYEKNSKLQITAITLNDPTGNGRIILDDNLDFKNIVEEKDCNDNERKIKLVNVGIYVVNVAVIKDLIPKITNNNAQGEYYLTDIVKLYIYQNNKVNLHVLSDNKTHEIINVNTKEQLDSLC